ncbi:MAG: 23S rRNA (pseudouridine(1915)-N(3))-methyltransferase RlmH [Oscillospiraceae bacterium]
MICVGNIKEKFLKDNINEYLKRIQGFCKLNLVELKEFKVIDENNLNVIDKALKKEEESILKIVDKKSYIITLCIEGKQLSSEDFTEKINNIITFDNKSKITFIVGSSYGLSQNIKNICNFQMSMSLMTFPHQFFRAMLLEQIYRSFTIYDNCTKSWIKYIF